MQDSINSNLDNQIDLRELLTALWAYKLFIAGTCALGIVLGGYYALYADKEFTSIAIFSLEKVQSGGFSINGEAGALAAMAGLSGLGSGNKNVSVPKDQVMGRVFIEKLDAKLNFQADPFFNTYDPNAVDPTWKALIKRAIGWQKSSLDSQERIWQVIVKKYSKSVAFDKTKNGGIEIVTRHENALRAAEIANTIMDAVITNSKIQKNIAKDAQLDYLTQTLAKALSDLELSQSNLQNFALENSVQPLESFAVGSLQLEAFREQLSRTSEMHDAVAELALLLEKKATGQTDYLSLRQQFPIVDQVEFRRVMGQNEIISSWSWPDEGSVMAVFDTLSERKNRLKSQINASQINAERSGEDLEIYAKFEREAKVAQAAYTVLIEQVKAQSMMAGYRPDNSEVYEYAAPSIGPSAPKRTEVLTLGGSLGLLVGCVLALVFASRRGVYYTKNSLIAGAQARYKASAKVLTPLRQASLEDLNILLMKKPFLALRDLAVEIHKSGATQVVVTSLSAKLTGNDAARALASYMQSNSMKVALIDFSEKGKKLDIDAKTISVGSFVVVESVGQVSVLKPGDNLATMGLLSQRDFLKNLQSLSPTFDLIFLCADNVDAISLLRALEGQKTFHITIARTKHTKSDTLSYMRSLMPVQGLLHD